MAWQEEKKWTAVFVQLFKNMYFPSIPFFPLFFIFSTKTPQNMFALRKSSSPLRQIKISKKVIGLSILFIYITGYYVHPPNQRKQKLSLTFSYVDIWPAFFSFLIMNFGGICDIHKERETHTHVHIHRKTILIIFVVGYKIYLAQVNELRNEGQFQFSTIFSLEGIHSLFV